jgi:hypothetical protein
MIQTEVQEYPINLVSAKYTLTIYISLYQLNLLTPRNENFASNPKAYLKALL